MTEITRRMWRKKPVIVVTDSNEPVSTIIHESFRMFQKPVDCNEIKEAIREAVNVKGESRGKK